jgi:hypothetical protein
VYGIRPVSITVSGATKMDASQLGEKKCSQIQWISVHCIVSIFIRDVSRFFYGNGGVYGELLVCFTC